MTLKVRLTEADSVRMLACRALAGLARSETVRQIIGKLPIVTDGILQSKLMFGVGGKVCDLEL